MSQLSDFGLGVVSDLSNRYGISQDAVITMIQAVINGNGTMAQFYCPELGGGGQWMRGGMTMVGDMFNNGLKNTVNNLCGEIANILAGGQMIFAQPAASEFSPQGQGFNGFQSGNWWPDDLGYPSSSGSQNNVRYAIFPDVHRLAIDLNGSVTVYDTLDHQIGGVGQQQGGNMSVTFTSQYGTVFLENLPIVDGHDEFGGDNFDQHGFQPVDSFAPPPPPQNFQSQSSGFSGNNGGSFQSNSFNSSNNSFQSSGQNGGYSQSQPSNQNNSANVSQNKNLASDQPMTQEEVFNSIERLGKLRDQGYLSDEEFIIKKNQFLQRL